MHLGHVVVYYYRDTALGARNKRPAIVIGSPDATGAAKLYVLFAPEDREGGAQSPSKDKGLIPRSVNFYDDDPARVAALQPCWSDL